MTTTLTLSDKNKYSESSIIMQSFVSAKANSQSVSANNKCMNEILLLSFIVFTLFLDTSLFGA